MTRLSRCTVCMLLPVLLVGGCTSDWLPFSGGALSGTPAPAPQDWSEAASDDIVQLETRPEDPYTVNLWLVLVEGSPYVYAGDAYTEWVQHIEQNPRVRLQANEQVYQLQAERVVDAEIFESFSQAWESKYGRRPMSESHTDTYLIRLRP